MKNTRIIGSRKKGFTLIELLVVVAILALLLAMMTPALSRVRDRANTVKCAANLRAVGQGVMLWAADWHNRLPPYEISDVASDQQYAITALGGNAQAWSDYRLLGQYIGNERYQTGGGSGHSGGVVLKSSGAFCPGDKQDFPHWSSVLADPERDAASYGFNVRLQSDSNVSNYRGAWGTDVTLKTLKTGLHLYEASKTILMVDAHYPRWDPGYGNTPPAYGAPEPYTGVYVVGSPLSWWNWAMRHANQRGANVLFIDGHVSLVEDDLATPIADRAYLFKKLMDY
jgi:prepilin-type N-terminal cleavage/methylation domain-containing protein/prepilin-type processing-associated H-X9-DG protein